MAEKKYAYDRVFAYASLQFCGHIEDYFATHSRDALVFIVQPRLGARTNLVRRYHEGVLQSETAVRSSQNVFLYYLLWYVNHVTELLRFCPKRSKTLILGGHPVVFFGMSFFKLLRPLIYAYWIGDYFPSAHPVIRLFERVKKYYHDRVAYAFYLSNAINQVMNGAVVETPNRRTVMWGMKAFPLAPLPPLTPFSLLFVGLMRPGQGIEKLFVFLRDHHEYRLSIIGVCPPALFSSYQDLMRQYGLNERVFFPNQFFSEAELLSVARSCHVGLALYDTDASNFTHYADPGKVKAYMEMQLPVIMTRISDVVPFIERFGCGEVIGGVDQLGAAIERIRAKYAGYREGVGRFNDFFLCTRYYREAFQAIEDSWT